MMKKQQESYEDENYDEEESDDEEENDSMKSDEDEEEEHWTPLPKKKLKIGPLKKQYQVNIPTDGVRTAGLSTTESSKKTTNQEKKIRSITAKSMVFSALGALNGRNGLTIAAIKKYMKDMYDPGEIRLKNVTKIVTAGIRDETIIQTKGTGCSSGSRFKLPPQKLKRMKKREKEKALSVKVAVVSNSKKKKVKEELAKRKAKNSTKAK